MYNNLAFSDSLRGCYGGLVCDHFSIFIYLYICIYRIFICLFIYLYCDDQEHIREFFLLKIGVIWHHPGSDVVPQANYDVTIKATYDVTIHASYGIIICHPVPRTRQVYGDVSDGNYSKNAYYLNSSYDVILL